LTTSAIFRFLSGIDNLNVYAKKFDYFVYLVRKKANLVAWCSSQLVVIFAWELEIDDICQSYCRFSFSLFLLLLSNQKYPLMFSQVSNHIDIVLHSTGRFHQRDFCSKKWMKHAHTIFSFVLFQDYIGLKTELLFYVEISFHAHLVLVDRGWI
jgi:hypothetical protein